MNLVKIGRQLSFILRHQPSCAQIWLDDFGYAPVGKILNYLDITMSDLEAIVKNNNKKRFSFNADKTFIKANQGHSVSIKFELDPIEPPEILYHGTKKGNMKSLLISGIKKMSRHHVHLSEDYDTAVSVGTRHGTPLILEVYARDMHKRGMVFLKTENGVWLTDYVPANFFMFG